jgi:hypothetical protein
VQIDVRLPTLHADQRRAYELSLKHRFLALRCGRRWGKTNFATTLASEDAIGIKNTTRLGMYIGFFAPEYKFLIEPYSTIKELLLPVKNHSSESKGKIATITGGEVDFWSLENEKAGLGRRYHRVIIDEAASTKPNMMDIWERSIKPTLLDYRGTVIVASNTKGSDPENFLWRICNEKNLDGTSKYGFHDFQAPTHNNPTIPIRDPSETDEEYAARRQFELIDDLIANNHPLVYRQEYLAEFVDWSGVAFFSLDKLFVDKKPIATPHRVDGVFSTIDTATKTGTENDGTAVIHWGVNRIGDGPPLAILDWDVTQIEGSLLETWLPVVFQNGEALAKECHARNGYLGAWIEDKSSGMVLLQHAQRRGWPAHAIDSKLTSVGKDERAISVSGYVYRGDVKMTKHAHDKVIGYKGSSRNHLVSQIVGFRVGDKDASRDDDLLDDFCYGIAIALGNPEGF